MPDIDYQMIFNIFVYLAIGANRVVTQDVELLGINRAWFIFSAIFHIVVWPYSLLDFFFSIFWFDPTEPLSAQFLERLGVKIER